MVFGFGKKKVELRAPFAGELVALVDVPDQLFSEKMLGDGFAIRPAKDVEVVEVVAPCAGKLSRVFNTKHAFAMVSDEGLEILVHIGLETVELAGEGFEALAATGDHVEAGQPVIRMDVAAVRAKGLDPVTPVVCTKAAQVAKMTVDESDDVPVCIVTLK
ncbi:PTS system, glucose-specific IIA component [Bowdeniella nasicola]|uniref:PTS system, glucose-specific IIA component n=1 Tax=Bowdeniella nasicola TaxID=208480 RepID=A0A1H3X2S0_9ACTO|nr:PTS glucose transporter subunit IIA [Bowdeniella nasicola]SDZ93281.1 PTS system, glucose-specific IIA component [Bowdeniella nasicola]